MLRRQKKPKAPTELALDILLVLFEDARGSGDLADAVSELRGQDISAATFFRQLQRAVDSGWVETREPVAAALQTASSSPGRPGRSYRLTASGERVLRGGVEQQRRRVSRAEALGLLGGG